MITPNQLRFIEELETTTKTQGFCDLCHQGDYCALGVGAELFKTENTLVETSVTGQRRYDDHRSTAPDYVVDALGLNDSLGSANRAGFKGITELSDSRKPFKEIAAILRENPEVYFK